MALTQWASRRCSARHRQADTSDVDKAVAAARRGLTVLAAMTALDKSAMLHRLADEVERNADELAYLEALNLGMPIADAKFCTV